MDKTLIVARMRPGSEQDIASVFAASDATELPGRVGVQSRTLFRFHDLYMHLHRGGAAAERRSGPTHARTRCSGKSARTSSPFVSAYDPDTWRVPSDAMATAFYHWRSPDATSR